MPAILVNLSPWPVGGFTSVTAHAYRCLWRVGLNPQVIRLNIDKTEKSTRTMAYGVPYRNLSVADGLKLCQDNPTLVTGVAREKDLRDSETIYKLVNAGAKVIVHGYTEHKQFDHIEWLGNTGQGVCIRESMCNVYKGINKYLPHPYFRKYSQTPTEPRKRACSCAMVVPHKHPDIILAANRLLTKTQQVQFIGNEDRMYVRFKLSKEYPEYVARNKFSGAVHPATLCAAYELAIDLSLFEKGNGGTQYTFFEAMDAGCICIINRAWLADVGDMQEGFNCLVASNPQELADLVKSIEYTKKLAELKPGYEATLNAHGPRAFAAAFKKLFGV